MKKSYITKKCEDSIDAVVTWVDGTDPFVRERIEKYKNKCKLSQLPGGMEKARYKDNGEIEWCLNGIRKMMPWIRKIFLVTDGQKPEFLTPQIQEKLGVVVIDHHDIFHGFEWALPTFNSRTIETMLYRIPGISGRYIYLNDDFIPVSPSKSEDFFIGEKIIVRAKWEKLFLLEIKSSKLSFVALKVLELINPKGRTAHVLAQMNSAKIAGFKKRYLHCSHAPHPVKTDTLLSFFKNNPDLLNDNIRHKFRSMKQFVTHPLAHHLEASKNHCLIRKEDDSVTINFLKPEDIHESIERAKSSKVKFVCLQNLEMASQTHREETLEIIKNRIFMQANQ